MNSANLSLSDVNLHCKRGPFKTLCGASPGSRDLNSQWRARCGMSSYHHPTEANCGRSQFRSRRACARSQHDCAHSRTGNIPPEIGQLTNLRKLDLSWNKFSGAARPSISLPPCDTRALAALADTANAKAELKKKLPNCTIYV